MFQLGIWILDGSIDAWLFTSAEEKNKSKWDYEANSKTDNLVTFNNKNCLHDCGQATVVQLATGSVNSMNI